MSAPAERSRQRSAKTEIPLALAFGALFAFSPVSAGSRVAASLGFGFIAGAAVYLYRRRVPADSAHLVDPPRRSAWAIEPRVWGFALLCAVALGPTMARLVPWYTESVWRNGHGLFLPLWIAIVVRFALRGLGDEPRSGSLWGLCLLLPGLCLIVLDAGIHSLYLAVFGATLAAAGASLLHLGVRRTRALAVPVLLILFFMPLPSGLAGTLALPNASAVVADFGLQMLGTVFLRDGIIFDFPSGTIYAISHRCSGFAIWLAGIALSLTLGRLAESWRTTVVLLLATWPLVVVANGLRSALLLWICALRGLHPSQTALHGMSGIAAFLAVIVALLILAGATPRRRLIAG